MRLRKGVYPYEDMDIWEKFDETTMLPKGVFHSKINEEVTSDVDYPHVKKVWEVFKVKNRDEYHDLYAQSDTLLLADVFKTLGISVMKYINLILYILCLHQA